MTLTNTQTKHTPPAGNTYLYPDTPLIQYYQFPDFLLQLPLSQTERILYMILYDRARLSQKNQKVDEKGRIFCYYTVKNLAKKTGKSVSAVKAALNHPVHLNLLEKVRCESERANRLYIKIPSENRPLRGQNSDHGTVRKQTLNHTNINHYIYEPNMGSRNQTTKNFPGTPEHAPLSQADLMDELAGRNGNLNCSRSSEEVRLNEDTDRTGQLHHVLTGCHEP